MEVLEERRTNGMVGKETASRASVKKNMKRRSSPAYGAPPRWQCSRCCSSRMAAFLMFVALMQMVSLVARGSVII
ncbi:unnamed protein product [Gongylonema pulchrum]|uniref:Uncharacterized protein n=1 Tax=Gongylonema pulchrum TaxID=637853 RepID=A0A183EDT0_9BILA|nr:unnamed protein product [Gongylonema pulchrum]